MDIIQKFGELKQEIKTHIQGQTFDESFAVKLEQLEEMLKEKQRNAQPEAEEYKNIIGNARDYIIILDKDGIVQWVNSAACEKYQIAYEEFINTSVLRIDASIDKKSIFQNIDELLKTGSTRFEAVHVNTKGEKFIVDIISQQIIWENKPAFVHVCRDITRQKELQKALNDSENKLKKIINQISNGIIIYEQSGKIVIWNKGVERITGIGKDRALGNLLYNVQYELFHGEHKDMSLIREKYDEVVNMTNPSVFETVHENDIFVEGKGVRILQSIVFPIETEEEIRLFGSVWRDVTEGKKKENQLRELIATRDKIFSIIAHDLRTPFTSIIGFIDLLLENYDHYDAERIKKILHYINLSARPTLDVLTNLLNWVSSQTGQLRIEPEACRLKSLVGEVVGIMTPAASIKNIEIIHLIPSDYKVHADKNMMKSVLQNLINNSIKFSHEGGKIEVVASMKNEFAEISVVDEGTGMDKKLKDALFSVDSHQSKIGTRGEKGSGLGLTLCREFVERHGGEIRVESEPGRGCRFTFTIPVYQPDMEAGPNVQDDKI